MLPLAELIWQKIKGRGTVLWIVRDDPFEYDVHRRVPSTEKVKRVWSFEATTTLDQMLNEVTPRISQTIKAGSI